MLAYGKNVLFMTAPKKIKKAYINQNKTDNEVLEYIKKNKIHYVLLDSNTLNKMCKEKHQGVVLELEEFEYSSLQEVIDKNFLVILDHLEDPHNFGAIIRSSEAAGVEGIIIPKDRSVSVTDTVMKTSVGTTDTVPIVKVTNINTVIDELKEKGFFIYGADMEGTDIRKCSFADKKVLVIGNEGKGISSLTSKKCDEMISIPMIGKVNSLNASVAAGILLFKMGGLS